jgi:hypothetical protein
MNNLLLASSLSLGALIPILFYKDPIVQAGLLWLAMQLSIQISFKFVPNALKVAVIACIVILAVQIIWYISRRRSLGESFAICSSGSAAPNGDCLSDDSDSANAILSESAALSRDLESYLRVDVPDTLQ